MFSLYSHAELLNDTKAVLESVRGGVSNITHVLENTVKILIIIQGRNYTELRKLAESEYKLAFNASKHSNIRLNETNYLYNEILKYRPRLLDLNATFRNQIERSLKTMVTSMEGATLNNLAKTYKSEVIHPI